MFLELPEKVAIVTGAAQGIGFAIAERLSRAGARVWSPTSTRKAPSRPWNGCAKGEQRPWRR